MNATGIQPWPRDEGIETILAEERVGTLTGPVFAPGLTSYALAIDELRMAVVRREPLPMCGCCDEALRFEDIYLRLTFVRHGEQVAALCGECLQTVYSRLRAVSHASGDDRQRRGIAALNSAFELMVMEARNDECRMTNEGRRAA